jgi:hypothetical protein
MYPLHLLANFFGGIFLANSLPHLVNGVSGRPFQTPFAKPSGVGLSSSTVNVAWGFMNLVFAYLLLDLLGGFDINFFPHVIAASIGALLVSLFGARHFGRFHGGNAPS